MSNRVPAETEEWRYQFDDMLASIERFPAVQPDPGHKWRLFKEGGEWWQGIRPIANRGPV